MPVSVVWQNNVTYLCKKFYNFFICRAGGLARTELELSRHWTMNIAVYCSSRSGLGECYENAAAALGKWIGSNGHSLVYGGSNAGTMHTLAQAAHDAGAHITGVVPECFALRADPLVDTLIPTADLAERKGRMIALADLFVVLPGGIGTIDEWISTLTHLVVSGDRGTRIVVVNIGGVFNEMLAQIAATAASPFARGGTPVDGHCVVAAGIEEMINQLNAITNYDNEK